MTTSHLIAAAVLGTFFTIGCDTANKTEKSASKQIAQTQNNSSEATVDLDQIMQAALEGKLEKVLDALNKGFYINSTDANKHKILMLASFNGHTSIVRQLIDLGAT